MGNNNLTAPDKNQLELKEAVKDELRLVSQGLAHRIQTFGLLLHCEKDMKSLSSRNLDQKIEAVKTARNLIDAWIESA